MEGPGFQSASFFDLPLYLFVGLPIQETSVYALSRIKSLQGSLNYLSVIRRMVVLNT